MRIFNVIRRPISLVVVICFTLTSVIDWRVGSAFAAKTDKVTVTKGPSSAQVGDSHLDGQGANDELRLPEGLGTIDRVFPPNAAQKGKDVPFIYYIQDAHTSLEAQENISKVIQYLVKEKGVKKVLIEGYEGNASTVLDTLYPFKDQEAKSSVSHFFLDYLRLSGAQYSYINRDQDFSLQGIESNTDYLQNIKTYENHSKNQDTISQQLLLISKPLKSLASQIYPQDFQNYLKLKERFETKKLSLADYIFRLMKLGDRGQVTGDSKTPSPNTYPPTPHLDIVTQYLAKQSLTPEEEKELNEKLKTLDSKTFFTELKGLENDIVSYCLQDKGDRGQVIGDSKTLPPTTHPLTPSSQSTLTVAQQTYRYQRQLELLNKLNQLTLTPEEYKELSNSYLVTSSSKDKLPVTSYQLQTQDIAQFLANNLHKFIVLKKEWESLITDAFKFYELVQKRDLNFQTNILQTLKDSNQYLVASNQKNQKQATSYQLPATTPTILVTGGFHQKGITDFLEQKQISYAVISPRITKDDPLHEKRYNFLMSGNLYPFEKPFLNPVTVTKGLPATQAGDSHQLITSTLLQITQPNQAQDSTLNLTELIDIAKKSRDPNTNIIYAETLFKTKAHIQTTKQRTQDVIRIVEKAREAFKAASLGKTPKKVEGPNLGKTSSNVRMPFWLHVIVGSAFLLGLGFGSYTVLEKPDTFTQLRIQLETKPTNHVYYELMNGLKDRRVVPYMKEQYEKLNYTIGEDKEERLPRGNLSFQELQDRSEQIARSPQGINRKIGFETGAALLKEGKFDFILEDEKRLVFFLKSLSRERDLSILDLFQRVDFSKAKELTNLSAIKSQMESKNPRVQLVAIAFGIKLGVPEAKERLKQLFLKYGALEFSKTSQLSEIGLNDPAAIKDYMRLLNSWTIEMLGKDPDVEAVFLDLFNTDDRLDIHGYQERFAKWVDYFKVNFHPAVAEKLVGSFLNGRSDDTMQDQYVQIIEPLAPSKFKPYFQDLMRVYWSGLGETDFLGVSDEITPSSVIIRQQQQARMYGQSNAHRSDLIGLKFFNKYPDRQSEIVKQLFAEMPKYKSHPDALYQIARDLAVLKAPGTKKIMLELAKNSDLDVHQRWCAFIFLLISEDLQAGDLFAEIWNLPLGAEERLYIYRILSTNQNKRGPFGNKMRESLQNAFEEVKPADQDPWAAVIYGNLLKDYGLEDELGSFKNWFGPTATELDLGSPYKAQDILARYYKRIVSQDVSQVSATNSNQAARSVKWEAWKKTRGYLENLSLSAPQLAQEIEKDDAVKAEFQKWNPGDIQGRIYSAYKTTQAVKSDLRNIAGLSFADISNFAVLIIAAFLWWPTLVGLVSYGIPKELHYLWKKKFSWNSIRASMSIFSIHIMYFTAPVEKRVITLLMSGGIATAAYCGTFSIDWAAASGIVGLWFVPFFSYRRNFELDLIALAKEVMAGGEVPPHMVERWKEILNSPGVWITPTPTEPSAVKSAESDRDAQKRIERALEKLREHSHKKTDGKSLGLALNGVEGMAVLAAIPVGVIGYLLVTAAWDNFWISRFKRELLDARHRYLEIMSSEDKKDKVEKEKIEKQYLYLGQMPVKSGTFGIKSILLPFWRVVIIPQKDPKDEKPSVHWAHHEPMWSQTHSALLDTKKYLFERFKRPPPAQGSSLGAAVVPDFEAMTPIESFGVQIDQIRKANRDLPAAITIFGSARINDGKVFTVGKKLGRYILRRGFVTRTGAGPALMEAPNIGQIELRTQLGIPVNIHTMTQGIRIQLPWEQHTSPYVENIAYYDTFGFRKQALYENSMGIIALPGGFGTMDEAFEVWERGLPVVFLNKDFWDPILDTVYQSLEREGIADRLKYRKVMRTYDNVKSALNYLKGRTDQYGVYQSSDQALLAEKDEMGMNFQHLMSLPEAVVFIGRPKEENGAIARAKKLASLLNAEGIPVRVGSPGVLFNRLYETAEHDGWLPNLQAILYRSMTDDFFNEVEPSLQGRDVVSDNYTVNQTLMNYNASAYMFFPGAIGTMSKLFNVLTNIQTKKESKKPIILVGKKFWEPIKATIAKQALEYDKEHPVISPQDPDLLIVVDTAEEAMAIIKEHQAKASSLGHAEAKVQILDRSAFNARAFKYFQEVGLPNIQFSIFKSQRNVQVVGQIKNKRDIDILAIDQGDIITIRADGDVAEVALKSVLERFKKFALIDELNAREKRGPDGASLGEKEKKLTPEIATAELIQRFEWVRTNRPHALASELAADLKKELVTDPVRGVIWKHGITYESFKNYFRILFSDKSFLVVMIEGGSLYVGLSGTSQELQPTIYKTFQNVVIKLSAGKSLGAEKKEAEQQPDLLVWERNKKSEFEQRRELFRNEARRVEKKWNMIALLTTALVLGFVATIGVKPFHVDPSVIPMITSEISTEASTHFRSSDLAMPAKKAKNIADPEVIKELYSADSERRMAAIRTLKGTPDPDAIKALINSIHGGSIDNARERAAAAESLTGASDGDTLKTLIKISGDMQPFPEVKTAAAETLDSVAHNYLNLISSRGQSEKVTGDDKEVLFQLFKNPYVKSVNQARIAQLLAQENSWYFNLLINLRYSPFTAWLVLILYGVTFFRVLPIVFLKRHAKTERQQISKSPYASELIISPDEYKANWSTIVELEKANGKSAFEMLLGRLKDPHGIVRSNTAKILDALRDRRAGDPLAELLNDSDPFVREAVLLSLAGLGDDRAIEPLGEMLINKTYTIVISTHEILKALDNFTDLRVQQIMKRYLTTFTSDERYGYDRRDGWACLGHAPADAVGDPSPDATAAQKILDKLNIVFGKNYKEYDDTINTYVLPALKQRISDDKELAYALKVFTSTLEVMIDRNIDVGYYTGTVVPNMIWSLNEPKKIIRALEFGLSLAEKGYQNCQLVQSGAVAILKEENLTGAEYDRMFEGLREFERQWLVRSASVTWKSEDVRTQVHAEIIKALPHAFRQAKHLGEITAIIETTMPVIGSSIRGRETSDAVAYLQDEAAISKTLEKYRASKAKAPSALPVNQKLIELAKSGHIDINRDLPDIPLKQSLLRLKKAGLNNVVIIGGAVRDLFFNQSVQAKDMDLTIKLELSPEDQSKLGRNANQATSKMIDETQKTVAALAKELHVTTDSLYQGQARVGGITLHYFGPTAALTNVYIESGPEISAVKAIRSFVPEPSISLVGIDTEGRIYGSLTDLGNKNITFVETDANRQKFALPSIVRALRVKHQYGIELTSETEDRIFSYLLSRHSHGHKPAEAELRPDEINSALYFAGEALKAVQDRDNFLKDLGSYLSVVSNKTRDDFMTSLSEAQKQTQGASLGGRHDRSAEQPQNTAKSAFLTRLSSFWLLQRYLFQLEVNQTVKDFKKLSFLLFLPSCIPYYLFVRWYQEILHPPGFDYELAMLYTPLVVLILTIILTPVVNRMADKFQTTFGTNEKLSDVIPPSFIRENFNYLIRILPLYSPTTQFVIVEALGGFDNERIGLSDKVISGLLVKLSISLIPQAVFKLVAMHDPRAIPPLGKMLMISPHAGDKNQTPVITILQALDGFNDARIIPILERYLGSLSDNEKFGYTVVTPASHFCQDQQNPEIVTRSPSFEATTARNMLEKLKLVVNKDFVQILITNGIAHTPQQRNELEKIYRRDPRRFDLVVWFLKQMSTRCQLSDYNNVVERVLPALDSKMLSNSELDQSFKILISTADEMNRRGIPISYYVQGAVSNMVNILKDPNKVLLALEYGHALAKNGYQNCQLVESGAVSILNDKTLSETDRNRMFEGFREFERYWSALSNQVAWTPENTRPRVHGRMLYDFYRPFKQARHLGEVTAIIQVAMSKIKRLDKGLDIEDAVAYLQNTKEIAKTIEDYRTFKVKAPPALLIHQERLKLAESGKFNLDNDLPDSPVKQLLLRLRKAGLNDVVVIGGAVRNLFFAQPIQAKDIDLTVKLKLNQGGINAYQATPEMISKSKEVVTALIKELGVTADSLYNGRAVINGITLHYVGPASQSSNVYLDLEKPKNSAVTSLSPEPAINLVGMDTNGQFYGSLIDLDNNNLSFTETETNQIFFGLPEIVRMLRVKHQYGIELAPETEDRIYSYLLSRRQHGGESAEAELRKGEKQAALYFAGEALKVVQDRDNFLKDLGSYLSVVSNKTRDDFMKDLSITETKAASLGQLGVLLLKAQLGTNPLLSDDYSNEERLQAIEDLSDLDLYRDDEGKYRLNDIGMAVKVLASIASDTSNSEVIRYESQRVINALSNNFFIISYKTVGVVTGQIEWKYKIYSLDEPARELLASGLSAREIYERGSQYLEAATVVPFDVQREAALQKALEENNFKQISRESIVSIDNFSTMGAFLQEVSGKMERMRRAGRGSAGFSLGAREFTVMSPMRSYQTTQDVADAFARVTPQVVMMNIEDYKASSLEYKEELKLFITQGLIKRLVIYGDKNSELHSLEPILIRSKVVSSYSGDLKGAYETYGKDIKGHIIHLSQITDDRVKLPFYFFRNTPVGAALLYAEADGKLSGFKTENGFITALESFTQLIQSYIQQAFAIATAA